eukprot:452791_1
MSNFALIINTIQIILYLASTEDINCYNNFECVFFQSINTTAAGYRSVSNIGCNGAYSCTEAAFIEATTIQCVGSNSCKHVPTIDVIYAVPTGLICLGSNSCSYSVLNSSRLVNCGGDQSCAYSNITSKSINGNGAYSLMYASIYSSGDGSTLTISLYGYNAGFGAKIICDEADRCIINCFGNACFMTYIECATITDNSVINITYSNCEINKLSNTSLEPIIDID